MGEQRAKALKIVDGLTLDAAYRDVLRPGALLYDEKGRARRLPRFFYEINSWEHAQEIELAPHFGLWEFIRTDVREAEIMRSFPKYVPCAITLLAAHLSVFRERVGTYVHIAANGGYRSPGHAISRNASPHHWGTAVNIYRIGPDYLDDQETIARYAAMAREVLAGIWVRPYGQQIGFADDHLHIDLGHVTVVPHGAAGEEVATEEEAAR